jgi:hypothetical protein
LPVSDPVSARLLTYHVVTDWVGTAVGIPANKVDVSRKFNGAPPAGYGFNQGRYLQMCDEITATLAVSSGRSFKLNGTWRLSHINDDIGVFINAVALQILAAKLTPAGMAAHEWAMGA